MNPYESPKHINETSYQEPMPALITGWGIAGSVLNLFCFLHVFVNHIISDHRELPILLSMTASVLVFAALIVWVVVAVQGAGRGLIPDLLIMIQIIAWVFILVFGIKMDGLYNYASTIAFYEIEVPLFLMVTLACLIVTWLVMVLLKGPQSLFVEVCVWIGSLVIVFS